MIRMKSDRCHKDRKPYNTVTAFWALSCCHCLPNSWKSFSVAVSSESGMRKSWKRLAQLLGCVRLTANTTKTGLCLLLLGSLWELGSLGVGGGAVWLVQEVLCGSHNSLADQIALSHIQHAPTVQAAPQWKAGSQAWWLEMEGGGMDGSPVLHPSAQLAPAPTHTGWWPSRRQFVELITARPAWSCPLCGTKAAKQGWGELPVRAHNGETTALLSAVSFKCCQTYVISSPPETLIWKEIVSSDLIIWLNNDLIIWPKLILWLNYKFFKSLLMLNPSGLCYLNYPTVSTRGLLLPKPVCLCLPPVSHQGVYKVSNFQTSKSIKSQIFSKHVLKCPF